MIGSEEHFRQELGAERAQRLVEILRAATTLAKDFVAKRGWTIVSEAERTIFNAEATQGIERASEELGLELYESGLLRMWLLGADYALRVKKLGTGYQPSNHESAQQARIGLRLDLPGLEERRIVTIGPRYSWRTGEVVEYAAVRHWPGGIKQLKPEWVADLEELASGVLAPAAATLPLPDPGTTIVRPRRREDQGEVSGEQA